MSWYPTAPLHRPPLQRQVTTYLTLHQSLTAQLELYCEMHIDIVYSKCTLTLYIVTTAYREEFIIIHNFPRRASIHECACVLTISCPNLSLHTWHKMKEIHIARRKPPLPLPSPPLPLPLFPSRTTVTNSREEIPSRARLPGCLQRVTARARAEIFTLPCQRDEIRRKSMKISCFRADVSTSDENFMVGICSQLRATAHYLVSLHSARRPGNRYCAVNESQCLFSFFPAHCRKIDFLLVRLRCIMKWFNWLDLVMMMSVFPPTMGGRG